MSVAPYYREGLAGQRVKIPLKCFKTKQVIIATTKEAKPQHQEGCRDIRGQNRYNRIARLKRLVFIVKHVATRAPGAENWRTGVLRPRHMAKLLRFRKPIKQTMKHVDKFSQYCEPRYQKMKHMTQFSWFREPRQKTILHVMNFLHFCATSAITKARDKILAISNSMSENITARGEILAILHATSANIKARQEILMILCATTACFMASFENVAVPWNREKSWCHVSMFRDKIQNFVIFTSWCHEKCTKSTKK